MNHKAPYEHLIAGKLETLPVPDMADAIWARIESQLDTDMPTDEGDPSLPDGPAGSTWSQTLLFVAIIAIMSLFSIPKKNITAPNPSATETSAPVPNEATAQPPPATQSAVADGLPRNLPSGGSGRPVATDSPAVAAVLPPADTAVNRPLVQQQVAPPLATPVLQDTLPRKKPRGVPGIGDADYRIVPKKDTGGNN